MRVVSTVPGRGRGGVGEGVQSGGVVKGVGPWSACYGKTGAAFVGENE